MEAQSGVPAGSFICAPAFGAAVAPLMERPPQPLAAPAASASCAASSTSSAPVAPLQVPPPPLLSPPQEGAAAGALGGGGSGLGSPATSDAEAELQLGGGPPLSGRGSNTLDDLLSPYGARTSSRNHALKCLTVLRHAG